MSKTTLWEKDEVALLKALSDVLFLLMMEHGLCSPIVLLARQSVKSTIDPDWYSWVLGSAVERFLSEFKSDEAST